MTRGARPASDGKAAASMEHRMSSESDVAGPARSAPARPDWRRALPPEALWLAAAFAVVDGVPDLLLFPATWATTLSSVAAGFLLALLLAAAITTARATLRRNWVPATIVAVALAVMARSAINIALLGLAGRADVGVEGYALPQTKEAMRMMFFVNLQVSFLLYGFYGAALGLMMTQRARLESRIQLTAAQLEVLRLQLAPHFLMNAFNSLLALVERDRKAEASEMIFRMSGFFRDVLRSDLSRPVSLSEELDNLHDYLAIEQGWLGDRLELELQIAPEAERAAVAPQILQPLVENVIHHVVAPTDSVVRLQLTADVVGDTLEIRISNTLPAGWEPRHRGTGLGQRNVAERLIHLHGRGARLETRSEAGTYEVRLSIPCPEAPVV